MRAELVAGQLLGLGATLSLHRPDGASSHASAERLADLYAPRAPAAHRRRLTPPGRGARPLAGRDRHRRENTSRPTATSRGRMKSARRSMRVGWNA
ncbi:hypothetical protein [Streptomyces sp. A1136]|uniref:hypothetical protein n=1 Tax=Streptomyces sp. A1136 TaxID=2563102 RepID=UPI0027955692|nr:hypothetical protein [Streptomyces sp. A1136]